MKFRRIGNAAAQQVAGADGRRRAHRARKTRGWTTSKPPTIDDDQRSGRSSPKCAKSPRRKTAPAWRATARNIEFFARHRPDRRGSQHRRLKLRFLRQATCEAEEEAGGICSFNSIDLGIATASARKWPDDFTSTSRECIPSAARRWIWACWAERGNRRWAFR